MLRFVFLCACGVFLAAEVWGQTPTPTPDGAPTNRGVWRAELPGGTFVVALSQITSVSSHEYVVDNTARVTEVTVGMGGSLIGRFYFLEPKRVCYSCSRHQLPSGLRQNIFRVDNQK